MSFNEIKAQYLVGELLKMKEGVLGGKPTSVFGLGFGERTHIASLLAGSAPLLYVARDIIAARNVLAQAQSILGEGVWMLPARADVLTFSLAASGEAEFERINALYNIVSGNAKFVVTTANALTQRFPHPIIFSENILQLEQGSEYDIQRLLFKLLMAGYKREHLVSAAGQFSARGDIVDIFPLNHSQPVRLSFFGDLLESIRSFDLQSQASIDRIDRVSVCPATSLFLSKDMAKSCVKKMYADYNGRLEPAYDARIRGMMSSIEQKIQGSRDFSLSFIEPYIDDMCSLTEYFTDCVVVYDDAKQIVDNVAAIYREHYDRVKHLLSVGEVLPRFSHALLDRDRVFCCHAKKLAFHNITSQNNIFNPQAVFTFKSLPLPRYSHDIQTLADDVRRWQNDGYKVILACASEERVQLLRRSLAECNDCAPLLSPQRLENGFIYHESRIVALGAAELGFKKAKRLAPKVKTDIFNEIKSGDYVVHFVHGIGKFEGIVRMGEYAKDYFKISYQGSDILYVPTENMDSLSKYSGGTEQPRLNKLGGSEFRRMEAKARESAKKLAFNLLAMYAARASNPAKAVDFDDELLAMFEDSFAYEETPDQLEAIEDIKRDFKNHRRMDRLVCGDVGYGKTEVALRAAFMTLVTGQQVAFLAPTTILAEQHFNTARARLEPFGLRVECLSRFRKPKEIAQILQDLRSGKVNMVCGTHRILQKDVAFFDLGLLILDEEQRFGVNDKERIRALKNDINVLTLSATPIPRTLHMSMSGIKDISVISTPPEERIPPQVYVTEYSEGLVYDAVSRELSRGGQCFIVYNRVEKIDAFAHNIRRILPDVNIIVAHGQMQPAQLESAITDFYEGRAQVLLCSTIIENGVDFARANTMIVCDSDRFGLATLYQLRGRVGRSNRLAYVYFTFNEDKILTENAYKRLDTITEFTEFGSGFKIAMRDLEIRGAGNVLGAEQHGHMERIGYELYCRLLNEEVKRAKGGASLKEQCETVVYADFDAYAPKEYIEGEDARLRLLKLISELGTLSQMQELMAKIKDIYGAVPQPLENLAYIGLIKNMAAEVNAREVTVRRNECQLVYASLKDIPPKALSMIGAQNGCALKLDAKTAIAFRGSECRHNLQSFLIEACS